MYTFTGQLIDSNQNVLDEHDFSAKSILDAKEKLARKHPHIMGVWERQNSFTDIKPSSIGTIHLLIPAELAYKTGR